MVGVVGFEEIPSEDRADEITLDDGIESRVCEESQRDLEQLGSEVVSVAPHCVMNYGVTFSVEVWSGMRPCAFAAGVASITYLRVSSGWMVRWRKTSGAPFLQRSLCDDHICK